MVFVAHMEESGLEEGTPFLDSDKMCPIRGAVKDTSHRLKADKKI